MTLSLVETLVEEGDSHPGFYDTFTHPLASQYSEVILYP